MMEGMQIALFAVLNMPTKAMSTNKIITETYGGIPSHIFVLSANNAVRVIAGHGPGNYTKNSSNYALWSKQTTENEQKSQLLAEAIQGFRRQPTGSVLGHSARAAHASPDDNSALGMQRPEHLAQKNTLPQCGRVFLVFNFVTMPLTATPLCGSRLCRRPALLRGRCQRPGRWC